MIEKHTTNRTFQSVSIKSSICDVKIKTESSVSAVKRRGEPVWTLARKKSKEERNSSSSLFLTLTPFCCALLPIRCIERLAMRPNK